MSRLLALASLLLLTTQIGAQHAPDSSATPTAKATCLLEAFTREGYRVHTNPADSTRRLLSRTLTGVDARSGRPNLADSYTENVTVRVDAGSPGVTIEQANILRPTTAGARPPLDDATARLNHNVQSLLREADERCSR